MWQTEQGCRIREGQPQFCQVSAFWSRSMVTPRSLSRRTAVPFARYLKCETDRKENHQRTLSQTLGVGIWPMRTCFSLFPRISQSSATAVNCSQPDCVCSTRTEYVEEMAFAFKDLLFCHTTVSRDQPLPFPLLPMTTITSTVSGGSLE